MEFINELKKERDALQKKLDAINSAIKSYEVTDSIDNVTDSKSITISGFPENGSYLEKVIFIIKTANRFLHNSEIAKALTEIADIRLDEDGDSTFVTYNSTTSTSWGYEKLDISALFSHDYFGFLYYVTLNNAGGMYIDDIKITGIRGYPWVGKSTGDKFGNSVGGGNFNGDAYEDIVIGTSGTTNGNAYIHFGDSTSMHYPRQRETCNIGYIIDTSESMAQSFIPRQTGKLWAVEVRCWDVGTDSTSMTVAIHNNAAGPTVGTQISGTSTTIDFSISSKWCWCR